MVQSTHHLNQRRAASSVMIALSIAGIALLVEAGLHPRADVDGFLALILSTFGMITVYRAWQLATRTRGKVFVPSTRRWKRYLFAALLLLSGALTAYLYFSSSALLIVGIFLLLAANLVLMLLFDSASKESWWPT